MDLIKIRQNSKYGRGLYAAYNIASGVVVERSPLIIISDVREMKHILKTKLRAYIFVYKDHEFAVALGRGSLFNHSNRANVTWHFDEKEKTAIYTTIKDIKAGAQMFIDYGYDHLHPPDNLKDALGIDITDGRLYG